MHTLKFDKSIQQDARDALKLMMGLFEANYSSVTEIERTTVERYELPSIYAMREVSVGDISDERIIRHSFEIISGERCADPFSAIATFIMRLYRFASLKNLGSELTYGRRAEITFNTSFECGHEWYVVGARLIIVGDDNLPGSAND